MRMKPWQVHWKNEHSICIGASGLQELSGWSIITINLVINALLWIPGSYIFSHRVVFLWRCRISCKSRRAKPRIAQHDADDGPYEHQVMSIFYLNLIFLLPRYMRSKKTGI